MRLHLLALFAGALWGLVAFGFGGRAYGDAVWGGVLAAPFIGLLVGALLHPRFSAASGGRRWLVALASLYTGATLFAIAVGLTDALTGAAGRRVLEVIAQAVVGTWWGVTLTGFVIALWPLAYGTHAVLAWLEEASP